MSGCRLCPRASAYLWCGSTSAVQHFDLHGEAKRAVSATAEVHTGIVGWQSDVGRWFVHLEFI